MITLYDVVVPTSGRPELRRLLLSLAAGAGPRPGRVLVVDDRRDRSSPLVAERPPGLHIELVEGLGGGPASARNLGWRASRAQWVAFLDDDVVCPPGWRRDLAVDLAGLGPGIGGSQGQVHVTLPSERRPTDSERRLKGLETAWWTTADMAYRRAALLAVGGFDERFPRAYREDADLALRVQDAGFQLARGRRHVEHPVPPTARWESLARQAGNADDALLLLRYGWGWRRRLGGGRGRRPQNTLLTVAALVAGGAALAGRPRLAGFAATAWLAGSLRFAWQRVAPGPRTPAEMGEMLLTSAAIPPLATWHWLRGLASQAARPRPPLAVLFDRDGTLVEDVPYNGDPDLVQPRTGARAALDRLRSRSVPIGVVSNQSGVARGLLTQSQVTAVNRRVEDLLGPVATWAVCPHAPEDGCECRKPKPGLVLEAAARLGVAPDRCVLVGDIGADVEAARAAGARGILVPTPATLPEEVAAAAEVVPDLETAVARALGERR